MDNVNTVQGLPSEVVKIILNLAKSGQNAENISAICDLSLSDVRSVLNQNRSDNSSVPSNPQREEIDLDLLHDLVAQGCTPEDIVEVTGLPLSIVMEAFGSPIVEDITEKIKQSNDETPNLDHPNRPELTHQVQELHSEGYDAESIAFALEVDQDIVKGILSQLSAESDDSEDEVSEGDLKHMEIIYPNGDRYSGQTYRVNKHGKGVLRLKSGDVYEGDFKNDCYDGHGTYTSLSGFVYTGQFKKKMMCGYGKMTFDVGRCESNLLSYEGEFSDDLFNGVGTLYFVGGSIYQGEVRNGLKHGKGVHAYPDGSLVEGNFEKGDVKGKHFYTIPQGTRVEIEKNDEGDIISLNYLPN
mmetsp:Transcript_32781/g.57032  ORF Transcript_32781/g.57032 Transcript_32781/m.57032 type:complete len:355 (+) Transcript_32781:7676-8740(+)